MADDAPNREQPATGEPPTIASPIPAEASSGPGKTRIFGDYELLEEIARGGMGIVYKARQVSLNRIVAVKMILAGELASPEAVQRFHAEAKTAAGLQHAHIVAIHEVGQHEGQHYFSMDYVEGRSLADMVREAPLQPEQAARYVKVIAEAIHFAHQQGTLHRDLKPSNVLIDRFDQPRVTDFGLAKRVEKDPAKLTATGAILGTPSYMPPEQASADRGPLGPASDVYSLGAVLYELVSGRPPFRAATPLDTILQVLSAEPAAPRMLNPGISRDLETIILKCLRKEPARRYTSARELAQDLERFLRHEPIEARRPALGELIGRWLLRHRKNVAVALVGAVLAVAAAAGAVAWLEHYRESRQGHVAFSSNGPPLSAEVLTEEGEGLVIPKFTVPTQAPVALPEGSYRLRLTSPQRLSETYLFQVERGGRQEYTVELRDRLLWEPLRLPEVFDYLDLGRRSDIVLATAKGMRRVDGRTGDVVWDVSLDPADQPALARVKDFQSHLVLKAQKVNVYGLRPSLVAPAPDLNGDGEPDLIWASSHTASLLAVSGKNGQVLWWARRPFPAGVAEDNIDHVTPLTGQVTGPPIVIRPDRPGDPPDVVALLSAQGDVINLKRPLAGGQAQVIQPAETWLARVSGRTGQTLWQYSLLPRWVQAGLEAHTPAQLVRGGGRELIACVADQNLHLVDVITGKPVGAPVALGFAPLAPPRFADLDGDGWPEALLLRREQDRLGNGVIKQVTLVAVACRSGNVLWRRALNAAWPTPERLDWNHDRAHPEYRIPPPEWPLVADLNGNGKIEILLPAENGGCTALGANGEPVWASAPLDERRYKWADTQRFVVGPDVDGDGCHDVFWAMLVVRGTWRAGPVFHSGGLAVMAEALSGATGRRLWSRRLAEDVSAAGLGNSKELGPLHWWSAGPDGWPQLVIPLRANCDEPALRQPTFLLSAGSGRVNHVVPELASLHQPIDLDGDGLADLVGLRRSELQTQNDRGRLHVIRGLSPESWRRLENWQRIRTDRESRTVINHPSWQPGQDFDGDGIVDLVSATPGPVRAISGLTGRLLWQSADIADRPHKSISHDNRTYFISLPCVSPPLALGDLDGDGTPDVLVFSQPGYYLHPQHLGAGRPWPRDIAPLRAVSGRTGKHLWHADDLRVKQQETITHYHHLGCHDLDGDGQAEILFVHNFSGSPGGDHLRVAVLEGKTGKARWNVTLMPDPRQEGVFVLEPRDLNGDGMADIVAVALPGGLHGDATVYALNGRDGSALWTSTVNRLDGGVSSADTIALDGDKAASVLLLVGGPHRKGRLQILDGKSGQVRWSWPAAGELAAFAQVALRKPAVVRHAGGARVVVPCDHDAENVAKGQSPRQLVLLDAQGHVLQRRDIKLLKTNELYRPEVWCQDLDGDGQDEVLFFDGDRLVATRDGLEKELWRSPLAFPGGSIREILPARADQPVIVVVHSGELLCGLDGRSGQVRWRCQGPGEISGLLTPGDGQTPPRIAYHVNNQYTVCRLAVPTGPQGDYQSLAGETRADRENETELQPLPWLREGYSWFTHLWVFSGILLLLLSWVLAARRWRGLLLVLGVYGLLTLLFAAGSLWSDAGKMLPGERYDWSGWYGVGFLPAAWTVTLAAFVLLVWAARHPRETGRRLGRFMKLFGEARA